MQSVGQRLKKLRKSRGFTQEEIAKKIGLEPAAISKYETGRVPIPQENILKLAKILETTADYLLCMIDYSGPYPHDLKKYKHLDNTLIGRVSSKMEKMDDDELELLDNLIDKILKDDV